ncbi:LOW QUALITY PROTEIN: hypothetical protein TorRG33x02_341910 [Trema orientale]|uniref:Uncharacterized protein n=1 Tax=Trema orientale TaxID=63057 RepID=A0A2P5AT62_TREOI|nr:LOW QUALITY PROTEIN: hypothetical protein TorRG33x02_341910 [Trema orientale]
MDLELDDLVWIVALHCADDPLDLVPDVEANATHNWSISGVAPNLFIFTFKRAEDQMFVLEKGS